MQWFSVAAFLGLTCNILKCAAAANHQVLYVLPDNSSNTSCPSQPCATLSQYLLDNNGTLPVVSTVEYHFLPGEHHLSCILMIENAFNFSMLAYAYTTSSPAVIMCSPVSHVVILHSSNVTIESFIFNGCSGIAHESLSIHSCMLCRMNNILFLQYGFVGRNLLRNSSLNNVTIKVSKTCETGICQGTGIFLNYDNGDSHPSIDLVTLKNININGINSKGINIVMEQNTYKMTIVVMNSSFHEMRNVAMRVYIRNVDVTTNTVLIQSCSFVSNSYGAILASVPKDLSTFNVIKCNFSSNKDVILLNITDSIHQYRPTSTNIMIKDCNFINNTGQLLNSSAQSFVHTNVYLSGFINIYGTKSKCMIYVHNINFISTGLVVIAQNVANKVMVFESCRVRFSNCITFRDNTCSELILIASNSFEFPYIEIMEFTNITIIDNKSPNYPITVKTEYNLYTNFPYPVCLFQFMTMTKRAIPSPAHYTIMISVKSITRKHQQVCSHCCSHHTAVGYILQPFMVTGLDL